MPSLELLYGSSIPWPEFKPVNDTIRGGTSTSSLSIAPGSNIATFSGLLDITALGGAGFASQSTTFEPTRLSLPSPAYSGLSLSLLLPPSQSPSERDIEKEEKPSHPTKYVLVLKNTKPPTRPDGRRESVVSYEFEFDVSHLSSTRRQENSGEKGDRNVVEVEAQWHEFLATYRGRPKEGAPDLDPSDIYELSFMCRSNFGTQAGPFTLDISSLSAINRPTNTTRIHQTGLFGFLHRTWDGFTNLLLSIRFWFTGGQKRGGGSLSLGEYRGVD